LEWTEEDSKEIEEAVGVMSNALLKKQKLEFEVEGDGMQDEL
jgi:hypothetical protein